MHGDWLPISQSPCYTWYGLRLPAIFLGFLVNVLIWLALGGSLATTPLLQTGLLGSFLGAWISKHIHPHTTLTPASMFTKHLSSVFSSTLLGILFGACFVFSAGDFSFISNWLSDGIIYGLLIGGSGWMFQFLLAQISQHHPISSPQKKRYRFRLFVWFQTIPRCSLLLSLVLFGNAAGLCYWLSYRLHYGSGNGDGSILWLNTGLSVGLSAGLTSLLVGIILQWHQGIPRLAERLHWNGQAFFSLNHLHKSFLAACSIFALFGINYGVLNWLNYGMTDGVLYGLLYGLLYGFVYGLGYWLIFGLYQGFVQEHLEDQDRRTFNQGIRRSLCNGAIMSLVIGGIMTEILLLRFGLMGALLSRLDRGLIYWLNNGVQFSDVLRSWQDATLGIGWLLFLCVWVLVWAAIGGLIVLRHYLLRVLLARSHTFPWRARAFLDDATARVLLRKVGGGYGFVHRRLLDYFATHPAQARSDGD